MMFRSTDLRRLALLPLLGISACTSAPAPQPAPPPPSAPVAVAPPPMSGDWRDWPLAPGRWRYASGDPISSARYGEGAATQFAVLCDAATRRVTIMRAGTASELAVTTSYRTARFPAGHVDEGGRAMSAVILNARDAFLDELAFSRGRIAVMSPGLPSLAIPAWAEPARAIEDCRK